MSDGKDTVTRATFAKAIADKEGISVAEASELVDVYFDSLVKALAKKESVRFPKLFTFGVKRKKERVGRNPKTMEKAIISARNVVTFKISNLLKEKLNKNNG